MQHLGVYGNVNPLHKLAVKQPQQMRGKRRKLTRRPKLKILPKIPQRQVLLAQPQPLTGNHDAHSRVKSDGLLQTRTQSLFRQLLPQKIPHGGYVYKRNDKPDKPPKPIHV